jgi:glycosyltransferase involved in cell wall biosynthesis
MKIDIITPIRYCGPQKWGNDLEKALKNSGIEARNIHDFFGIIKRFFYTEADIIISTLPIFFSLHKKPIILTIHGNYNKENFWRYLYPLAIKKAKKITVPSEFLKNELKLNDSLVIPNGIFPKDYTDIILYRKDRLNNKLKNKIVNDHIIKIVTVTSFQFWNKAKGVLELLKILKHVKEKRDKKFEFIIVGGGKYLDKIKQESKKYNVNITFIGFHKNPKEILKNADLFVYYSFLDNLPIVILEAIACQVQVLSNNVGGVKEIIRPCKDNDEYINSIFKFLDKISLDESNESIRLNYDQKLVLSKFSWDNIVKSFIYVCEGVKR